MALRAPRRLVIVYHQVLGLDPVRRRGTPSCGVTWWEATPSIFASDERPYCVSPRAFVCIPPLCCAQRPGILAELCAGACATLTASIRRALVRQRCATAPLASSCVRRDCFEEGHDDYSLTSRSTVCTCATLNSTSSPHELNYHHLHKNHAGHGPNPTAMRRPDSRAQHDDYERRRITGVIFGLAQQHRNALDRAVSSHPTLLNFAFRRKSTDRCC